MSGLLASAKPLLPILYVFALVILVRMMINASPLSFATDGDWSDGDSGGDGGGD